MILTLLTLAVSGWIVWTAYALLMHYRQAQRLQVPILISPVGLSNILWLIFQDALIPYLQRLPFGLGSWTRYSTRSWIWQFHDRGRIHEEYGPIIAHVTPVEIQIWVADKDVASGVVRGKDRALFDKPREVVEVVDFLGPHLMTACGDTWKRHRRIVATPFTQRNNRLVWKESLLQGIALGEYWYTGLPSGVNTVWKDTETATMNVLVTAGFGLERGSQKAFNDRHSDSFDFHGSLSFILTNFIWVVIIPSTLWFPKTLPPFPRNLRDWFKSIRAFKQHLDRMIAGSKASALRSKGQITETSTYTERLGSDNLLTALVHHSEEAKHENPKDASFSLAPENSLSDDEIHANLFGLAFAGHETIAHTLAYSIYLLAAHPDIQDWVIEEIQSVLQSSTTNIENIDLDEIYPQLVRTRAVLYETLRLFAPLANVAKRPISPDGAIIQVGERTLSIPPKADVLPALYALHSREEYWGKDSLEWNPRRWISISGQGDEAFVQPSPPGSFLPWSDGPRVCPGARFSQVEFVAVCTALLSRFRIFPVALDGEDIDSAIGRVKAAVWDSTSVVTLTIKHPERVPLRLEPRGTST